MSINEIKSRVWAGSIKLTEEDVLKQKTIRTIWPVATVFFIFFIFFSFFVYKSFTEGWILLGSFLLFIITIIINFRTKNNWLVGNALASLGIPVILPWLVTGGPAGVGFWWSLVYVVWAFIVTRRMEALCWLLVYLVFSGLIVVFSRYGIVPVAYSLPVLLNLLFAYLITTIYVYFLVTVLKYYLQRSQIQVEELDEVNKHLDEKLEQLKAVNKDLETFSYSVSHDLRTPLRIIHGYADVLYTGYDRVLDREGKAILEHIKLYTVRMQSLIDDLLSFARLGKKEIVKTTVDMTKLTEGILDDIGKSMTHQARIRLERLHSVDADIVLVSQVMFNLLSNAIKYSSKKTNPLVEIFSEQRDNEIVFTIRDNGTGFDMKYADKLFGVFQRLHSQEEFEGSGLGLAIVDRIIRKHGGRVWAEGKVNEGASFYFSLPMK